MKFIKKDVNRRLLILVIILLVLFIASTIYYEVALKNVVNKYNKGQQIFGELTADAVVEELNKSSSLKETIAKYKEHFEKRYDELDTLNQKLKSERDRLQDELILIQSQIEYQKAKDIGSTSQFRLFQSKINEVSSLNKKIKELCSKLYAYNISDTNCYGVNWN